MVTIPTPTAAVPTQIATGIITPGLSPDTDFSQFSVRYGLTHKKTIMVNMA
ncbi:hypothetical protein [Roseomonas rosulenta]|uniref:hypothetical protein n=1 Tax=Roseomonas rosulenta TaxID=2748667 RepID=UPI0018DF775D|nr:hypothetical protein [Roseomonas rosulenta]